MGSDLTGQTTEIQTIEDPKLPRKRKAPVRHEFGEQDTHHLPETPKDHYKRIYLNAIDTVTHGVATRLEQEDFEIYLNIQRILLKCFASDLAEVVKMYRSRRFGFFQVKRTSFAFTTDSRVNGV